MLYPKYPKEYIEDTLTDLLRECLSSANQESEITSVSYNEETEECTIVMRTCITEECNIVMRTCIIEDENYIGFEGY